MTWHTDYLTPRARSLAPAIDRLPYHAPLLLLRAEHLGLCGRRLANLRAAWEAEQMRPLEVRSQPYHLVLDTSDLCNLRCPLCVQATEPSGRRRTMMSTATAAEALAAFEDGLVRLELFNWGEPLLNPAFVEIVHEAERAAVFSRTSTNFSLPHPPDMDALVESGLKWMVLSIDGATQETYEKYRVGGELERVLANLRRLVAAREARGALFPVIEWQFLALQHNVDEIGPARDMARRLGVDVFRYGGARGVMADRIRVPTGENYRASTDYLLEASHPLSEYAPDGEKLHARERQGCRWLWGKLAVHADGGVSPCWTSWQARSDFGSLTRESAAHLWRGETFRAARGAATGRTGLTGPATLCEGCASRQAFVNAPERLDAWPTRAEIEACAARLEEAGLAPAASIRTAVAAACLA